MLDENHLPPLPGATVLHVDRASEKVTFCNVEGASLLGRPVAGLPWWDALGVTPARDQLLALAVRTAVRSALPPTLLRPPGADELVAGGYLYVQERQGRATVVLILFELASGREPLFPRPLQATDVVAVLGVDYPESTEGWRGGDSARHMIDMRFGLQQIVPSRDDVGMPVGTAIPIALRDVGIEQARDIGKALL
nr:hypothetical protein [Halioglobus sp.]